MYNIEKIIRIESRNQRSSHKRLEFNIFKQSKSTIESKVLKKLREHLD